MNNPDLPDDEIEIDVRSPAAIGTRMIILAALIRRAYLENPQAGEDREGERFDLRQWLEEQGAFRHVSDEERHLLDAPLGSLTDEDLAEATMAGEALAALAWAANILDRMPSYGDFAPVDLLELIPEPWETVRSLVERVDSRSDAEIGAERERVELWHWRAGIESDRAASRGRDRQALDQEIGAVAREADAAGLLTAGRGSDLELGGIPFRELPDATRELILFLAESRLRALNWVCGFGEDWSDVPLDV